MQFLYLRNCVPLFSKTLKVDRQFFKDVPCVTLLQEGVGQYQFLEKIATHFPHFHLLTPPLKWRFLYIPPTPFYYNLRPCPPNVLLINNIYSWKNKLKHAGVDIKCFFVNKIFVNKKLRNLLEAPYRTSETSKLELFTKKVNGLKPKNAHVLYFFRCEKKETCWMHFNVNF